ncbi:MULTISPECIES: TetR/AcrR family transcriptional regulator [Bifidobacterium]|uniref:Transcriptional regulator, TetR family n=2 Tax=Bifidobacterium TaxID=1678 RepID=A0A0F4L227_9BIFI|nr:MULTISPECIES: TetR/AcrR family transcriptional regulator [Bifidobacterium]KJY51641.1 Transcriptional regulator, TetR family [Bifidobacterium mellis]MBI0144092.1 TetR/AcrR family transcriptional regulator [Bifidobacterium choladohabitans]
MASRTRKSPEVRRAEITQAAAHLISRHGYNGISLKDVADMVDMSQPGVLHYVGSKEGLLSLLITDIYDVYGTPEEFLQTGLPGSDPNHPHLPAYFDYLVAHNASQPELTQLYTVLETEAISTNHPLHDYFLHRPEEVWKHYSKFPWALPDGMDWSRDMQDSVRMSVEVMDGIQIRLLREPKIDYVQEWKLFKDLLFPLPLWDGYR